MLIRLTDSLHVAPEDVSRIETLYDRDGMRVYMKDGSVHWVPCDYGKSVSDTRTRLLAELNAGRAMARAPE